MDLKTFNEALTGYFFVKNDNFPNLVDCFRERKNHRCSELFTIEDKHLPLWILVSMRRDFPSINLGSYSSFDGPKEGKDFKRPSRILLDVIPFYTERSAFGYSKKTAYLRTLKDINEEDLSVIYDLSSVKYTRRMAGYSCHILGRVRKEVFFPYKKNLYVLQVFSDELIEKEDRIGTFISSLLNNSIEAHQEEIISLIKSSIV